MTNNEFTNFADELLVTVTNTMKDRPNVDREEAMKLALKLILAVASKN